MGGKVPQPPPHKRFSVKWLAKNPPEPAVKAGCVNPFVIDVIEDLIEEPDEVRGDDPLRSESPPAPPHPDAALMRRVESIAKRIDGLTERLVRLERMAPSDL